MLPDPLILAVGIPAILFAGISKGGFGSGASFAAAPILTLVMDPRLALGVLLPLLMLIDVVTLKSFWKGWHTPSVKMLSLGAVPGVLLGVWLYQIANADAFRLLIGAISLLFVMYQLSRSMGILRIPTLPFNPVFGLITGMVGGFTSFVSHAGGPPVAVFLLSQSMTKTTYQATTVLVFWVINILKFVPYGIIGVFTAESMLIGAWLAPMAVIGAYIGIWAHKIVPERIFFGITYVLLVTTGSKLIWDALT
jgi:uncharacterized membrane protein YfcA